MIDLNKLGVENHNDYHHEPIIKGPVASGQTIVYFRDLEQYLIQHINEADAVLGCIAWLTNKSILSALIQKNPVALVVQKEDFLRPDIGSTSRWKYELRKWYDALQCTWDRYYLPGIVSSLSVCRDPTMAPIRCVGNHNSKKYPAFPRMHHKFVVFCRIDTKKVWGEWRIIDGVEAGAGWIDDPYLTPYAVWTGSFNFTENACRSLENALYITDTNIVRAYVHEWAHIESLSEPLDWESEWIEPQWRIGT
jgi:hypothetical protein